MRPAAARSTASGSRRWGARARSRSTPRRRVRRAPGPRARAARSRASSRSTRATAPTACSRASTRARATRAASRSTPRRLRCSTTPPRAHPERGPVRRHLGHPAARVGLPLGPPSRAGADRRAAAARRLGEGALVERPRIALPLAGMELDLGGYVKEYAADRVAALLRDAGCRAALVDMGGDLAIVGPHPDGQPWIVGIRDVSGPTGPRSRCRERRRRRDERRLRALHGGRRRALRAHPRSAHGLADRGASPA